MSLKFNPSFYDKTDRFGQLCHEVGKLRQFAKDGMEIIPEELDIETYGKIRGRFDHGQRINKQLHDDLLELDILARRNLTLILFSDEEPKLEKSEDPLDYLDLRNPQRKLFHFGDLDERLRDVGVAISQQRKTMEKLQIFLQHFYALWHSFKEKEDKVYIPECAKKFYALQLDEDLSLVLSTLGEGSFGHVWERALGKMRIAEKTLHQPERHSFDNEFKMMSRLNHKHIAGLMGSRVDYSLQKVTVIYMEKAKGALIDAMKLSPTRLCHRWIGDILSALQYLEEKDVIHGDIKPDNFLISQKNRILLSDFGNSIQGPCTGVACSLPYRPPEIFNERKITTKTDIWCFGVMLYQWLRQDSSHPLKEMHKRDIAAHKTPWDNFPTTYDPSHVSDDLEVAFQEVSPDRIVDFDRAGRIRLLIEKCIVWNPAERASASELLTFLNT